MTQLFQYAIIRLREEISLTYYQVIVYGSRLQYYTFESMTVLNYNIIQKFYIFYVRFILPGYTRRVRRVCVRFVTPTPFVDPDKSYQKLNYFVIHIF